MHKAFLRSDCCLAKASAEYTLVVVLLDISLCSYAGYVPFSVAGSQFIGKVLLHPFPDHVPSVMEVRVACGRIFVEK